MTIAPFNQRPARDTGMLPSNLSSTATDAGSSSFAEFLSAEVPHRATDIGRPVSGSTTGGHMTAFRCHCPSLLRAPDCRLLA
jgi:hypothetical protein